MKPVHLLQERPHVGVSSWPAVHRWYPEQRDRRELADAAPGRAATQPMSYQGVVVAKPWGHEFQCFRNIHCAIWYLRITAGSTTSLHAHPGKNTAIVVLRGRARVAGLDRAALLDRHDTLILRAGVFHRIEAGPEPVQLLEIESPPAKTDLVRISDRYGRAGQGIEGVPHLADEWASFDLRESAPAGVTFRSDGCADGRPWFDLGSSAPCELRRTGAAVGPVLAIGGAA